MEFKTKRKTAVAFVLSMLILMLSVVCYMPKIADAAVVSQINYRRHDCSSSSLTSYVSYTLKLENNVNVPMGRSIIGDSNFVADSDTAVVRIEGIGTGFIVGDHIIATAAHCVFNPFTKKFENIQVYISDTQGNQLEHLNVKYIHVPSAFVNSENPDYDYAMIEVEEDLSEYESFTLGVATDEFISNHSNITVSGYPHTDADNDGIIEEGERYKANGKITSSVSESSHKIFYDADTYGGTSGGPVYLERNYFGTTYKTAVAIHTNGAGQGKGNSGVKVTSNLLKFYYSNSYKGVK